MTNEKLRFLPQRSETHRDGRLTWPVAYDPTT